MMWKKYVFTRVLDDNNTFGVAAMSMFLLCVKVKCDLLHLHKYLNA